MGAVAALGTGADLVLIALAVGSFLLVTGLGQLLRRGESGAEARNRRMRMLARGASGAEVLSLLKPTEARALLGRVPVLGDIPSALAQAGLRVSPSGFVALLLGGAVVGAMAGLVLGGPLGAAALALAGAAVPILVVSRRRARRLDALTRQLPDALDLMARGLRVGHPLNVSMGAVAREMPDPIGTEFGLVCDQVSYGDDLVSAFREFGRRAGVEDVSYLAASIAIQHGTGGDLARVVDVLSKTIRGRITMRRRIRAISSEGRLSAWFLTLLPMFIFASTSLLTPDYYRGVSDDPLFRPMMATIVGLLVVNGLVLRRLVNFRI